MHLCLGTNFPQHQLDIAGHRKPTGDAGLIVDQEARKTLRERLLPHIPTARMQSRSLCARRRYSQNRACRCKASCRGQAWPWATRTLRSLISNVQSLAATIAHRIVIPGGQAELLRVLAPGICAAAFRDHCPEIGICYHIRPGSRCGLSWSYPDYVFASIFCEATKTIKEYQVSDLKTRSPCSSQPALSFPALKEELQPRVYSRVRVAPQMFPGHR